MTWVVSLKAEIFFDVQQLFHLFGINVNGNGTRQQWARGWLYKNDFKRVGYGMCEKKDESLQIVLPDWNRCLEMIFRKLKVVKCVGCWYPSRESLSSIVTLKCMNRKQRVEII